MASRDCDVLILGAGPAGSTAAYILAAKGLRVTLLDRRHFPRAKLCGGLLTWKTIATLEAVFQTSLRDLKAERLLRFETRTYRVEGGSGPDVRRRLDFPFHFVDRTTYDHYWLKRAIAAGASFRPGTAVSRVDPARTAAAAADGSTYRGRFMIGAEGVHSRVRRALERMGAVRSDKRNEKALALEVFLPRETAARPGDEAVLTYGRIPWGYAWSFPGADHHVLGMAGLIGRSAAALRPAFGEFLAAHPLPRGAAPRIQSAVLPYGSYLPVPGFRNILLAGDAAGLADPFLGEGIYYAHRSAELAARAILETLPQPHHAAGAYCSRFRRIIYPDLHYARAGRQIVFSLPPRLYHPVLSAMLRLMPKVYEETIQGRRTFKWFRRQPPGIRAGSG
jgi:geranylgeranyl reductase family protein